MGLDCKYGKAVKQHLMARYARAFKDYPTLVDARNGVQATREQTVVVLDGNVLFHRIPQSVRTYDGFMTIVYNNLKVTIATAALTIVVFDQPEVLTEAKLEEQARRDSAHTSTTVCASADLVAKAAPIDDDFTAQHLPTADVHAMVKNRKTQKRFFDEMACELLRRLVGQIKRWKASGYAGGDVIFDGIDPRGIERPAHAERTPGLISSNEELAALFAREKPIGEGDIKLASLSRRVRELSQKDAPENPLSSTAITLYTTVDTDSFAIELIEEARRSAAPVCRANTLLCMKEASNSTKVRKRAEAGDDYAAPQFTCCDLAMLHALVQRDLWTVHRTPTPADQRAAMTLLATGWGLAGCDYVRIHGLRADVVIDSLQRVLEESPSVLTPMAHAWEGDRTTLRKMHRPIRALMEACADKQAIIPRINKDCIPSIRDPEEQKLKRAFWLAAYWNDVEHDNVEEFGFNSRPFHIATSEA